MQPAAGFGLAGLAVLAGCGLLPHVPDLSPMPLPQVPIENRVWLQTDADAPAGSFRVFLPDGTLIQDSCGETWRLSPWHRIDATNLVWEEDGKTIRAEIALLGPDALSLILQLGDGPVSESFRAVKAPQVCPETRG